MTLLIIGLPAEGFLLWSNFFSTHTSWYENEFEPKKRSSNESSNVKLPSGQTSKPLNIRAWEDFSFESETIQTNIPKEVIQKLLHIHWCWIALMFI